MGAKFTRAEVFSKYQGRCAYCGNSISMGSFHVDHRVPCYRGRTSGDGAVNLSTYTLRDVEPACPRCNRWKSVHSLEDFRREIQAQVTRLRRDVAAFRLAEDFRQVAPTETSVVFFFEEHPNAQ